MSLADELASIIRPIVQAAVRDAMAAAPANDGGPLPEYLSFARAGEVVDVSAKTIAAWVRAGRLKRYGPRGAERIRTAELRAFMAANVDASVVDFEDRVRAAREKLR